MTWAPHVVVASIIERDGKFLLVEEIAGDKLVLNQPAGHWEEGETLMAAAQREALEETGWDIEPTEFLGIYHFQPPELDYGFLRIAFIARAIQHHPQRKLDEGIVRTLWLSYDEIVQQRARHRSPSLLRCVEDYRKGQKYPLSLITHLPQQ